MVLRQHGDIEGKRGVASIERWSVDRLRGREVGKCLQRDFPYALMRRQILMRGATR